MVSFTLDSFPTCTDKQGVVGPLNHGVAGHVEDPAAPTAPTAVVASTPAASDEEDLRGDAAEVAVAHDL